MSRGVRGVRTRMERGDRRLGIFDGETGGDIRVGVVKLMDRDIRVGEL